MKTVGILLLIVFMVFGFASFVCAETDMKNLERQLENLMRQVEEQKQQIENLQNSIKEMQAQETPKSPPATVTADKKEPVEVKTTSKYKINFYGKLKFDAIYETNEMGKDEYITFVPREPDGEDKATFNIRDTRLGIAIDGPSAGGWHARGRFETDFYGSDPSSSGGLRIRLAYVDFQKENTSIRVGQDWNRIASLNPSTLDFGIMGYNGNLWGRIPQVTLNQKLGKGFEGFFTIYRYRWSDDDDTFGSHTNDVSIHMPWVGGTFAYTGKLLDPDRHAYLELSGAFRKGTVNDHDVTPYVASCGLKIPYSIFELTGEAYVGQGLGLDYFRKGGAFNDKGNAILTRGGFIQLSANPWKPVTLNAGYGLDDPKDADVGTEFYEQSQYVFGNVIVQVMKDISAGFEINYVETQWATTGNQDGTRYSSSLIYTW